MWVVAITSLGIQLQSGREVEHLCLQSIIKYGLIIAGSYGNISYTSLWISQEKGIQGVIAVAIIEGDSVWQYKEKVNLCIIRADRAVRWYYQACV